MLTALSFFLTVRQCKSRLDLALIVGSSETINTNNWSRMKQFLKMVVSVFDVRPDRAHIALVVFSTRAQVVLKFNDLQGPQLTASAVNRKIDSIPRELGLRFIDKALRITEQVVFTEANGMRKKIPKVCCSVTKNN